MDRHDDNGHSPCVSGTERTDTTGRRFAGIR